MNQASFEMANETLGVELQAYRFIEDLSSSYTLFFCIKDMQLVNPTHPNSKISYHIQSDGITPPSQNGKGDIIPSFLQ